MLTVDHSSKWDFTTENPEGEPLLMGLEKDGLVSNSMSTCLDTEGLVAYMEEEGDTACEWESDSEDSIHKRPQIWVKGRLRQRLQFWKEHLQAP